MCTTLRIPVEHHPVRFLWQGCGQLVELVEHPGQLVLLMPLCSMCTTLRIPVEHHPVRFLWQGCGQLREPVEHPGQLVLLMPLSTMCTTLRVLVEHHPVRFLWQGCGQLREPVEHPGQLVCITVCGHWKHPAWLKEIPCGLRNITRSTCSRDTHSPTRPHTHPHRFTHPHGHTRVLDGTPSTQADLLAHTLQPRGRDVHEYAQRLLHGACLGLQGWCAAGRSATTGIWCAMHTWPSPVAHLRRA